MEAMIFMCWMLTSSPQTICPPMPIEYRSQFADVWRGEAIDPGIFMEPDGDVEWPMKKI